MAVTTLVGNMFDSSAQTLVNTVNCVGIMGKGIALEFRKRFPDMFRDYERACQEGRVRLGEPYLYKRTVPPWILNFPTKSHWRSVSRLNDIVVGLQYLGRHYKIWGIESLAVPPLGCGEGQLEWKVVGPTLFRYLNRLDIPVELYAPYGTPPDQLSLEFLSHSLEGRQLPASRIPSSWVALASIVAEIQSQPYHWPIGRTIFQKIAFFATELGMPTGLNYQRASFGPFAKEIKPLLTKLVNNGILTEEPRGQMLKVSPGPTYRDAVKAYQDEIEDFRPIISKVADLFLRMPTNEAELAATVVFAARRMVSPNASEKDIFEAVKEWKRRRRPPIHDEDIGRTIRSLNLLSWLDARPSSDLRLPTELRAQFELEEPQSNQPAL
jgi:uncharacterized protein YwgA/O-acetyl-ADP-ribose deacetylase (regulator of RNase III)